MNYHSNLEAPDLRPYFKHIHERVEPNSQGHTVISDFADKADDDPVFGVHKRCWFWTLDEAAILYNCAKQIGGAALDIGSHTGWTTRYLKAALGTVKGIDPAYAQSLKFCERASENIGDLRYVHLIGLTSVEWFLTEWNSDDNSFDVVVIDGNHDRPCPVVDAVIAARVIDPYATGVILLHDYRGDPIKEAYRWLLANGFQGKVYTTPNGVAVCWRGDFIPPEHVCDPNLEPCV